MEVMAQIVESIKHDRVGMIHVAASRVFKRPKRPSAVGKAVGAVNINFPFSMQGQNRAEKVSSKLSTVIPHFFWPAYFGK